MFATAPKTSQHIFIPVLPESLLDYLSAPMPFLVGVHSSLLPKIYKLGLEEVVFCDLDGYVGLLSLLHSEKCIG